MTQHKKIIVIGAGAAGLLAAGEAALQGANVTLLEKMERVGRKLRITGKGRCNLTNIAPLKEFLGHIYPEGRFLRQSFSGFFSEDLIDFFDSLGIPTVTERGGRVFPRSDKATDIAEGLEQWVRSQGVNIELNSQVKSLIFNEGVVQGVTVKNKNGALYELKGDAVIVATGGLSYPATGSTGDGYRFAEDSGHTVIPPKPSLVPLTTEGSLAQKLQGLSLKNVNVTLWIEGKKAVSHFGEMLFTHFGLSGPVILTLSRSAVIALDNNNNVSITIDLKPALDYKKLDNRLLRDFDTHGKKQFSSILKQLLPSKMIPVFLELLNMPSEKQCHQVTSEERKMLRNILKNLHFEVTGYRPFKEAIITSGGISLKDVSPKTLESKTIKQLYFAGEVLDLDAETGGYNLQIAFSTGKLAGRSAALKKSNQALS